jgi:hypothetical protein
MDQSSRDDILVGVRPLPEASEGAVSLQSSRDKRPKRSSEVTVPSEGNAISGRPEPVLELQPVDLAEATRQLRAIVEALPPTTARERATARRLEGAAATLEALAERPPYARPA